MTFAPVQAFDRRAMLVGTGALLAATAMPLRAGDPGTRGDLIRRLMARPWQGRMSVTSPLTRDGTFMNKLELTFELDGNFDFTGKMTQSVYIGDTNYHAYQIIRGSVWSEGKSVGIDIVETRHYAEEDLPGSIAWGKPTMHLRFVNNKATGRPALAGNATVDRNSSYSVVIEPT